MTESNEKLPSDPRIKEITTNLQKYLNRPEEERKEATVKERALLLNSALRDFSILNTKARERVLPTLQRFIMSTIETEKDKPPVATNDGSQKLKEAADYLKEVIFMTTGAERVQLFRGTYEMTELNPDGSIKAHVVNRDGGGLAHTSLGTLARYSLMKAVLGHHLVLASEEMPGWPSGTNIWDNIAYFERQLGIDKSYIGNVGRLGGSGIEMTKERVTAQAGDLLDRRNKYWEYFQAGEADRLGCETVAMIRERLIKNPVLGDIYIPLPSTLDTSRIH